MLSTKDTISTFEFEKLADHTYFVDIGLAKPDFAITFQFVAENSKHIDLLKFC
jgi:hypothetical protein